LARAEVDPMKRVEFEIIAKSYRRLAIAADHNANTHLIYAPSLWDRHSE